MASSSKKKFTQAIINGKAVQLKKELDPRMIGDWSVHITPRDTRKGFRALLDILLRDIYKYPRNGEGVIRLKGEVEGETIRITPYEKEDAGSNWQASEPDEDCLEGLVRRYEYELSNYRTSDISFDEALKATKAWQREMRLDDEAAEILAHRVSEHGIKCYPIESFITSLGFFGRLWPPMWYPFLIGGKLGQMLYAGETVEKYERNVVPIKDLLFSGLFKNFTYLIAEQFKNRPAHIILDNARNSYVMLPPVGGMLSKNHETRHLLQLAAVQELINPGSALYDGLSSEKSMQAAQEAVLDFHEHLSQGYCRMLFYQGHSQDVLDVPEQYRLEELPVRSVADNLDPLFKDETARHVLGNGLFSGMYRKDRTYFEGAASSLVGHVMSQALPWGVFATYAASAESFPLFSLIFTAGISAFLFMAGYGNIPAHQRVARRLRATEDPLQEIRAVAGLPIDS